MPVVRGNLRAVRGSVVAVCCLTLSLLAHGLAGGGTPPVHVLVGLGVGLAATCTWRSGRRWRFPGLLTALLSAQAALHPVFDATATTSRTTAPPLQAAMVVAHLLAAVVLALLLTRGEDLLHSCVAVLRRRVAPHPPVGPLAVDRAPMRLPSAPFRPRPRVLSSGAVARRGPPSSATALLLPV